MRPPETIPGDPPTAATHTHPSPARIGRMIILAKLGEGGMGVVYSAYDPELDRKVAVKMLRSDRVGSDENQTRLLREAQALARLAHPNVVAIHDVSSDGRDVWLAMEFISGKTIATWLAEHARPWEEVIRVFLQATRGIEAAHRAGLLHRDIKPANIMIADDGRVRVMDFGLVRSGVTGDDSGKSLITDQSSPLASELTQTGARVGTPAYMAPEQLLGFAADERSDQFSLCVALWEALYGERPFATESFASRAMTVLSGTRTHPRKGARVPRWVRRVVERGLAPRREDRFASVAELRHALESDPTRRRWALALALSTILGTAAWLVTTGVQREQAIAQCTTLGSHIDAVWNDEARTNLRAALVGTGASLASETFERTTPRIDNYAAAWRQARTAICRSATVEHDWSSELAQEAEGCLADRLHHLEVVLGTFSNPGIGPIGRGMVENIVIAIAKLPPIDSCLDPEGLPSFPPPPDDEQARESFRHFRSLLVETTALQRMDLNDQALARAEEATKIADTLGIKRLQAAAAASLGSVLNRLGNYKRAETLLEYAYFTGGGAGDDNVESTAAEAPIFIVGLRLAQPDGGLRWGKSAHMVMDRVGVPPDDPRRALTISHMGLIYEKTGDRAQAQALLEQALQINEQHLGASAETAGNLHNLAVFHLRMGNPNKATELLNQAINASEQSLGRYHSQATKSRDVLAAISANQGDYDRAAQVFNESLAIQRTSLGEAHPDIAGSLGNLAKLSETRGDLDRALDLYNQMYTILERRLGADNPETLRALIDIADIHREQGSFTVAEPLLRHALEALETHLGTNNIALARPLGSLGILYRRQGEYAKAIVVLERAISIETTALGRESPELAASLHALGLTYSAQSQLARAVETIELALTIWEKAPGHNRLAIAIALANLGATHLRRGERARAIATLQRSVETHESITSGGPYLAHPLTFLGIAFTDAMRPAEAIPLLRRALALREAHPADPAELAETRFALAQALWSQPGERTSAETLARQARDGYVDRGPAHAATVRQIDNWLRKHYR